MGNNDLWLDKDFGNLDLRNGPDHFATQLGELAEQEGIEIEPEPTELPTLGTPAATAPEPIGALPGPVAYEHDTFDLEDGGKVEIQQTEKGWQGIADPGNGRNAEIFRGNTKSELIRNILVGKLNATKKINQLTRKTSLNVDAPHAETPTAPAAVQTRTLTAEDIVEIKTQLTSNPDLALDTWFQKKTGYTAGQLVGLLAQSQAEAAAARNEIEEVNTGIEAKAFRDAHPEYHNCNENYISLLTWLCNQSKAKYPNYFPQQASIPAMMNYLTKNGLFTRTNLDLAYRSLLEDGLLVTKPAPPLQPAPTPTAPPQPVVAAPAPALVAPPAVEPVVPAAPVIDPAADPRIVRPRRASAAFGIRQNEATTLPTDEIAPSDEDFSLMTDAEINQLFTDTRRHVVRASRR